jgi:predicted amino acid racemase
MAVLNVNRLSITKNLEVVKDLCKKRGCTLVPVTKICRSEPVIVEAFKNRGIGIIADSSLSNLGNLNIEIERFLLKLGLKDARNSDLECEYIYTSSMEVIKALSDRGDYKNYNVFLALELGDLREGILPEELPGFTAAVLSLPNISIAGLSANFGCLMGKLPGMDVSEVLRNVVQSVKQKTGFEFENISFGGTAVYPALLDGTLPDIVNQVRLGEAIFFGYNLCTNEPIPDLIKDSFILSGEILEIRKKHVDNKGKFGYNAFGEKIKVKYSGKRIRAVLDFGELGAPLKGMVPKDPGVRLDGSTHDYTVVDITESNNDYSVGGGVDFILNYTSAAQAYISPQIEKQISFKETSIIAESVA